MRTTTTLAFGLIIAALTGACDTNASKANDADGDDTPGVGVDTMVTERTVQDTTIVTHDTTVKVDTMVKRGGVVDSTATRRP